MSEDTVRKRFFINGEPSAALEMHGRYLKPVYKLLAQVLAQGLTQQEVEVDHQPVLMGTSEHGDISRKHYVGGATLRASQHDGVDEVWIDVHRHDVDTRPGGKVTEKHPYLWVGVQVHPDCLAFLSPEEIILAVYEPDDEDGQPRFIATGHPPMEANRPVTGRFWLGEQDEGHGSFPAWPEVYSGDHGLYFVGGHPGFGGELLDYEPQWGLPEFMGGLGLNTACRNAPYDPIPDSNLIPLFDGVLGPRWDSVVVLDPTPWLPPSDDREGPEDILRLKQMFKEFDNYPRVLAGNYVIKVGTNGIGNCDDPLKFILEVRLNKYPDLLRKRYEITIERGSSATRLMHPYGLPTDFSHGCDYQVGNNPHWRNWWSGAVLANVLEGVIVDGEPEPYYVPSHGFEPGVFPANLDCGPVEGTLVNVLFWGMTGPSSFAWMDRPDYFTEMAAVAFYGLEAGDAAVSGTIYGDPAQYPVSVSNPYWTSYGNPPFTPVQTILDNFASYSIQVGVVYMLVMNSRRDNYDGRYTITPTALQMQTLAYTTDYDAHIASVAASIAYPATAQVWGTGVPGLPIRLFNQVLDLDCMRAGDFAQVPSPAVEIDIPKGE